MSGSGDAPTPAPEGLPYDTFAGFYDAWVESAAAVTGPMRRFYVEQYLAADGPVVELGVGNGHVLIAAARAGCEPIGVDNSSGMLALCRRRAEAAGVADRIHLVRGDFRDFELPRPAALIAIPFHAIGHLIEPEDKLACLRHVRERLAPGGRLVFDHFVFDPELARSRDRVPTLRSEYDDAEGRPTLLWSATIHAPESRRLRVVCWTERLGEGGRVDEKRVLRMDFSWLEVDESRALLDAAGLTVEALYGEFDQGPFGPDSSHQIWVARRDS